MSMRVRTALLVGALLAACGGGDSTGPSGGPIDGTWVGGTSSNGVVFQTTLTLAEAGGNITGSGQISGSGPSCNVTVTGDRDGSDVTLGINCPGFQVISFVGDRTSGSVINGRVFGSGLPSTTFDLVRQ